MRQQSQKDPRWGKEQLGTCDTDFTTSGCFVTSLANLTDRTPLEVNKILLAGGGYTNGCLVNSPVAAKLLGLSYEKIPIIPGRVFRHPMGPAIAETTYYAPKTPQHFFILLPDNNIIDPLNPVIRRNFYPVKSLRIFKPLTAGGSGQGENNQDMTDEQIVTGLYGGFFGYQRKIEPEGRQHWVKEIKRMRDSGMGEETILSELIRGFLDGEEAQKHFKYII